MNIEGLKGEVFNHDGKVGIAIPPSGRESAIPFEIVKVHAPSEASPAWADLVVAGEYCRINPDICQPPFCRLADCVMVAHTQRTQIPTGGSVARVSLPPAPHPNAQDFVFWRENIGGKAVVMVDTLERMERFSIKPAGDGQTRHQAMQRPQSTTSERGGPAGPKKRRR